MNLFEVHFKQREDCCTSIHRSNSILGDLVPYCIIIDPCLFRFGGHEYAMNEFLCEEAQRSGYSPIVLCNHQFQEQASFPYKAILPIAPMQAQAPLQKKTKPCFSLEIEMSFRCSKTHFCRPATIWVHDFAS